MKPLKSFAKSALTKIDLHFNHTYFIDTPLTLTLGVFMKLFLVLVSLITAMYAAEYKAIFNLTSSDNEVLNKSLINNINNLTQHYKIQGDSLKVVVIISGGAYKYFIQDIEHSPYKNDKEMTALQNEFKDKLSKLSKTGVVFEMCGIGMKKHDIDKDVLYPFVEPVFSRTSSLIYWQFKGYSLVEVP